MPTSILSRTEQTLLSGASNDAMYTIRQYALRNAWGLDKQSRWRKCNHTWTPHGGDTWQRCTGKFWKWFSLEKFVQILTARVMYFCRPTQNLTLHKKTTTFFQWIFGSVQKISPKVYDTDMFGFANPHKLTPLQRCLRHKCNCQNGRLHHSNLCSHI